jgi:2-dehydro-3-deoxyphosphogluconate aldolase/(4S)-4-hydroxy-2-oxoglutarate aldolase
MNEVLEQIGRLRVVPVVAIDDADAAGPLADALVAGGLPIAEITFRTNAAEAAIRAMAKRKGMLVGAGTVLNPDTAKRAIDAGAKFIVSPGFNPKTVRWCLDNKVPITPGTATPTDVEMALDHGLSVVKFFPAEAIGGLKTLQAIAAPYGMMRFIPTGGISPDNLEKYLAFPKILACGGSWMVTKELLAGRQFERVTELTRDAVARAERARPSATCITFKEQS